MSAQSYIKLWTAEPSEHDEVQAYDLLSYEYDFLKPMTPCGQAAGKPDFPRRSCWNGCSIHVS